MKAKKKSVHHRTTRIKDRNPQSKSVIVGGAERFSMLASRAAELRCKEYGLAEIAIILKNEFNLDQAPCPESVCRYIKKVVTGALEQAQGLVLELRRDQHARITKLIRHYEALLIPGKLHIVRTEKVRGETVTVMDEKPFDDQRKLLETVIHLLAREAKLMGLDIEQIPIGKSEGMDATALFMLVQNNVQNVIYRGQGKPPEKMANVLEVAGEFDAA